MPKVEYAPSLPAELRKPHLAILAGSAGARGELTAVPVGSRVFIIIDPNKQDGIIPLVLAEVRRDRLVFAAVTDKPTANPRRIVFKGQWEGTYDASTRAGASDTAASVTGKGKVR
jgi:hypothetical protein